MFRYHSNTTPNPKIKTVLNYLQGILLSAAGLTFLWGEYELAFVNFLRALLIERFAVLLLKYLSEHTENFTPTSLFFMRRSLRENLFSHFNVYANYIAENYSSLTKMPESLYKNVPYEIQKFITFIFNELTGTKATSILHLIKLGYLAKGTIDISQLTNKELKELKKGFKMLLDSGKYPFTLSVFCSENERTDSHRMREIAQIQQLVNIAKEKQEAFNCITFLQGLRDEHSPVSTLPVEIAVKICKKVFPSQHSPRKMNNFTNNISKYYHGSPVFRSQIKPEKHPAYLGLPFKLN